MLCSALLNSSSLFLKSLRVLTVQVKTSVIYAGEKVTLSLIVTSDGPTTHLAVGGSFLVSTVKCRCL